MSLDSKFMSLPREIRDIIYQHYIFDKNGYRFNYESKKFRTSNNELIPFSLMYTCKSVAAEMRGVHLRSNTLVFSTVYSEAECIKAGRFNRLMNHLTSIKDGLLDEGWRNVKPEVRDMVVRKYPQFQSLVDEDRTNAPMNIDHWGMDRRCWGEPRSVYDGFVNYSLGLLRKHMQDDFFPAVIPLDDSRYRNLDMLDRLLALSPMPWAIPSEDIIMEMDETIDFNRTIDSTEEMQQGMWKFLKHRFSAAAVAISFLHSLPQSTLLQIRYISLHEDRESISYAPCHAMGLIHFCKTNTKLRITRVVDVWRNALPAGSDYHLGDVPLYSLVHPDMLSLFEYEDNNEGKDRTNWRNPYTDWLDFMPPEDKDQLHAPEISTSFSVWIEEALALFDAGMPVNAFSLVFDGEITVERSSEVFEIVIQDAVWQEAVDECCKQKSSVTPFRKHRGIGCYYSRRFPQAIKDIIRDKSIIRCNFPVGGPWDMEQILDQNRHYTYMHDWEVDWLAKRQPIKFQTVPPLPTWVDLRLDRVFSKGRP